MMRWRFLWLLPALVIGLAVAVWLMMTGPEPERLAQDEIAVPVRVITATATPVAPEVVGYGFSRPARSWSAVAAVRGTVIETHPDFADGRFIPEGETVLHIDPAEYELALAEARADLAALQTEADQLAAEEINLTAVLRIERERLTLAEQDLERIRQLVAQGAASQARLDEQERATLTFRRTVQELENAVALLPVQQERLDAQMARTETRIARAQRDLDQTVIVAPFDMRVAETKVEAFQFVNAGQTLLSGEGTDRAEIVAQVPVEPFRRVIAAVLGETGLAPLAQMHMADTAAIGAEVRLVGSDIVWQARIEQVQTGLDARTRTVQVVVSVADPYDFGEDGVPLVRNMYLEVALTGPQGAPAVVLPDAAVHGDRAIVMGADDRLELRHVTVAFRQGGQTVLRDGVAPGERVVLDDLVPAIAGTLLRVANDNDASGAAR
jgi:multidrug efflux pump subunit AcrA (membrane-fusion protein)